jgi:hypothetical protein
VVVQRLAARPPSAGRLEGGLDRGPYEVQWQEGDVLSSCTSTALGMSLQYPAWRCSGRDGHTGLMATEKTVPAGLTSQCSHA